MTPTTRKHPRTLSEAFPRTGEYACSIEGPAPTRPMLWVDLVLAASIVAAAVLAVLLS